jgi:hypothetical protein
VNRKLVTALAVIAGVLVLLVIVAALRIPSGSIATSEDGAQTVDIAMLAVPIADEKPLVEAPDQFLGVPHPAPEFETGDLGPDLTFDQDISDLPGLDPDEVLRAVYLGHDTNGDPYYLWHSGSPGFMQMIGQIIADFGAVGRLETSYGTEMGGDALWDDSVETTIAEMGLTTGSIVSSGEQTTLTAEWHALPSEVVAVVLYDEGQPLGWQRPVSGTAAFELDFGEQDPDSVGRGAEMVALTISADTWNRYVLFPG